jgi:hypothetical protein
MARIAGAAAVREGYADAVATHCIVQASHWGMAAVVDVEAEEDTERRVYSHSFAEILGEAAYVAIAEE